MREFVNNRIACFDLSKFIRHFRFGFQSWTFKHLAVKSDEPTNISLIL